MKKSPATKVLMIEPVCFGFNEQTADSNSFQQLLLTKTFTPEQIQELALLEFNHFVERLRQSGIEVLIFKDTKSPFTPDSIFPNNWFNTDPQGRLLIFPMATENRQLERRTEIISELEKTYDKDESLIYYEKQGSFLEGTGSLIIDYPSNKAFAALSPRTNELVLEHYAQLSGNEIISFTALGPQKEKIYHTNVMLCITDNLAIIGTDTIVPEDRTRVIEELQSIGKEIIYLSNEQVYHHFAGNMLQLQNQQGTKFLIMSSNAQRSLTTQQIDQIHATGNQIIAVPLNIIEQIGGGSARCMLAELF